MQPERPTRATAPRRWPWGRMIAGALALAVIALVVSVLRGGRRVPDGPEPVVWNQQACAHCRMAVGEPAHAAQLITTAGDVRFFDDPGCLLQYVDQHQPSVHRIWFHEHDGDRWLAAADVGFVPVPTTPMGFGLGATHRTAPGALSLDEARARVTRSAGGEAGAHAHTPGMP